MSYEKRFVGARAVRAGAREAVALTQLAAAGLHVPTLMERRDGKPAGLVLVLAPVPGRPLDDELDACGPGSRARALMRAAGAALARWHAAGFVHGHAYAWHIWVGPDDTMTCLDVASARRTRSPRARRRDLAALTATLGRHVVSRAGRRRLVSAYLGHRSCTTQFEHQLRRDERRVWRHARLPRVWRGVEHHSAGGRVLLHDSCAELAGTETPEAWFEPAGAVVVRTRDGRSNLRWPDAVAGESWFGKAFERSPRRGRAHAMTESLAHRLLDGLAIPVPTVRVVARPDDGRSIVWTAAVTPGETMRDRLHRGVEGRPALAVAALMARRLHREGITHGDLYLDHFVWSASRGWVLLDLGRVRVAAVVSRRRRVKDLAALDYSARTACVSRSDRLRAFVQYRGGRLCRDAAGRRLLRAVIGKADHIERRERRHGRFPVPRPEGAG